MSNRIRIILLALVVVGTLIYMVSMAPAYLDALYTSTQKLISSPSITRIIQDAVRPHLPTTTSEELFTKINQYRISVKRPPFLNETSICGPLQSVSNATGDVFSVCPQCSHATMLTIGKFASSNQMMERLLTDDSTLETLQSATLTHVCIAEKDDALSVMFVKKSAPVTPSPRLRTPPPASTPTYFSEDDLWLALTEYRQAHGKPALGRDERMCTYARKRVQEHIDKMNQTAQSEYPNPDKYPLDAHAGFSADASSGYAFEVTGRNQLAENLAYWPTAKSAAHIIEWGWDTSTEGHREAQLSDTWSHACISGNLGFYVAIYGK
jgi:uncharacterized protein YkwD